VKKEQESSGAKREFLGECRGRNRRSSPTTPGGWQADARGTKPSCLQSIEGKLKHGNEGMSREFKRRNPSRTRADGEDTIRTEVSKIAARTG